MSSSRPSAAWRHERRGLLVGVAGNIVGTLSGIAMYMHSHSDALLLDGLYTAVLAVCGLVAVRVSQAAVAPRSRAYPFGASGQEPLYLLFQALLMIGMVVYAGISAAGQIIAVSRGGAAPDVELSGLGWYFSAMVLLNLGLWWHYRSSWRLAGGHVELLLSNSNTCLFDAAISAGTGLALVGSPLLLGTPLGFVAPLADPLIVLVLSALFLPAPLQELLTAVRQAAGVSVEPALQQRCRKAMAAELAQQGCSLIELAMIKLGRSYTVVAYVDPAAPLASTAVDQLRQRLDQQMQQLLQAPVLCEVIPTAEHPYTCGSDQT